MDPKHLLCSFLIMNLGWPNNPSCPSLDESRCLVVAILPSLRSLEGLKAARCSSFSLTAWAFRCAEASAQVGRFKLPPKKILDASNMPICNRYASDVRLFNASLAKTHSHHGSYRSIFHAAPQSGQISAPQNLADLFQKPHFSPSFPDNVRVERSAPSCRSLISAWHTRGGAPQAFIRKETWEALGERFTDHTWHWYWAPQMNSDILDYGQKNLCHHPSYVLRSRAWKFIIFAIVNIWWF